MGRIFLLSIFWASLLACHSGSSPVVGGPNSTKIDPSELGGTSSGGVPVDIQMNASPTFGALPQTVTFRIAQAGDLTLDFGDGSNPETIHVECSPDAIGPCATTTHTYVTAGLFTATIEPLVGSNWVQLAMGGTQKTPALLTVTPVAEPGDIITVTGSGFIAFYDDLLFDGWFGLGLEPSSDTTATLKIPPWIGLGTHSVVVRTANGSSNSLTFTVE